MLTNVCSTDEPSELQYSDIFFFTTGLKTLPPLGLRPHPSIHFLHDVEKNEILSQLPKANTCANSLFLPTVHQAYTDFKNNMMYAIQNCQGFGFC